MFRPSRELERPMHVLCAPAVPSTGYVVHFSHRRADVPCWPRWTWLPTTNRLWHCLSREHGLISELQTIARTSKKMMSSKLIGHNFLSIFFVSISNSLSNICTLSLFPSDLIKKILSTLSISLQHSISRSPNLNNYIQLSLSTH